MHHALVFALYNQDMKTLTIQNPETVSPLISNPQAYYEMIAEDLLANRIAATYEEAFYLAQRNYGRMEDN